MWNIPYNAIQFTLAVDISPETIEEQTSSVEEVEEIEDELVQELISAKECDVMLQKITHYGMVNGLSDMVESVSKTNEKHQ